MKKSKPTATIVQLATPNINSYAIYSILSINHYCKKYGYKHVVQRTKTVADMHINWSKIDLLDKAFEMFPESDYILLVDADVIITNYDKDIEYFVEKYCGSEDHIIMAQDTPLKITKSPRPNAGFVLLKNSQVSKQMVKDWLSASTGIGKAFNDTHPRNQLVYWGFVMPDYLNHQVVLPRFYFMKPLYIFGRNLMPTKFLYHITQSSENDRIEKMKLICMRHIDDVDEKVFSLNQALEAKETFIHL